MAKKAYERAIGIKSNYQDAKKRLKSKIDAELSLALAGAKKSLGYAVEFDLAQHTALLLAAGARRNGLQQVATALDDAEEETEQ